MSPLATTAPGSFNAPKGASQCRLCGAALERVFVDLGAMPLANALLREEDLVVPDVVFPLYAHLCEKCLLVQTRDVVRPEAIFSDYAYFSSYSDHWLGHARRFAEDATDRLGLTRESLVLEVASNDGYLLTWFMEAGFHVLGVEPAANVAAVAAAHNVPTIPAFFGLALANELAREGKQADLVVANNVLAHVPDLNDFVAGLALVLRPTGALSIEVPHVMRLIERTQFDTIYHEHFSYFSLLTARRALARHGLEVFDVEELPTHGGSLRIWAQHHCGPRPDTGAPERVLTEEASRGLHTPCGYEGFGVRVSEASAALHEFLYTAREAGKRVAGYGAPAKASTLLNSAGVGPGLLPFTVDRNPHKQGRYFPGARIPILPPDELHRQRPDYVLILPWNLQAEILDHLTPTRKWGARCVLPIPKVQVLP